MQQYIGFKLSGNEFTIPILKVREIINTPAITKLPQSPHYMKGIINLRGRIIPVVALKELVNMKGVSASGASDGGKIIVVANRSSVFGVLVDSITSVINIDESDIESPSGFINDSLDRIEGIAKFDDRLVILLDTNKIVDMQEMDEIDSGLKEIKRSAAASLPASEPAPAPKAVAQPAPKAQQAAPSVQAAAAQAKRSPELITVKDLHTAKNIMRSKLPESDSKNDFLEDLVMLMNAMATQDYEAAEDLLAQLMHEQEGDLYKQIGQVTRKLHDSLKSFKNTLDPRIKQIADEEVPQAVDSLEYVIKKTEEAANTTLNVVEKYQSGLAEFESQLVKITSPEEFIEYLNRFRSSLKDDLTEIMMAQEFQDITGQTIRRVIELVNTIEVELISLITTFGVKMERDMAKPKTQEKVSQSEVEDLLAEFGF